MFYNIFHETVSIEECTFTAVDIVATDASSVVTTDGEIIITPTSGVSPYLYSIDGGQNFIADNIFPNLPVGPYNIIVQDATNICFYEIGVPIEVDALGIEDETSSYDIKIYPNPTNNYFSVEIRSSSELTEAVNIVVYDNLGRTIQTSSILNEGNRITTISLNGYVSGTYFIKCSNGNFEKHFKVVKI